MSKNINDLREAMFDSLAALRKGEITVEQAKAISEIGQVIINSAKVDAEYAKSNGGGMVPFLESPVVEALPNGVVGITRHRLVG